MEAMLKLREGGYCRNPGNEKAAWRVAPSNGPKGKTRMSAHHRTKQAENAKAAAILAYSWGYLSFETCSDLFRNNPEWRSA